MIHTSNTSNTLQLILFGTPQIIYRNAPLSGFISNKVRALLIYLAVTGRPHSRDHLAHLLWSNTPMSMKVNLRKALSNLRHLIGDILVEHGQGYVSLDHLRCWADVVAFEQFIQNEKKLRYPLTADSPISSTHLSDSMIDIYEATQLYHEDFLQGFNLSLSDEFESWAFSEQNRLKSRFIQLLYQLVIHQENKGNWEDAILFLRRLVTVDPWHDEAQQWLIELLAKNGQRSAALMQFERFKLWLRQELAIEPDRKMLQVVQNLQTVGRAIV